MEAILAMYEGFYCLSRNPFLLTSDPEYLFLTKAHEEALCGMLYTIAQRKGFMVLTGEAGTGKTTLVQKVMASTQAAKAQFSLILNPTLTQAEFLDSVLIDFGITDIPRSKVEQLALLQKFLLQLHSEGKSAVLVVDEAHKLSAELLEEIRLLTNLELPEAKLLQVILVGQNGLDNLLEQECMQQMKQRVVVRLTLSPLAPQEVEAYVQHRWSKAGARRKHPFVGEALRSIASYSHGIPRLVNVICDNALLNAYADGAALVGEKHVLEAAKDLELLDSSIGAVARGPVVTAEAAGSDGRAPALLPPSDPHSISIPTLERVGLKLVKGQEDRRWLLLRLTFRRIRGGFLSVCNGGVACASRGRRFLKKIELWYVGKRSTPNRAQPLSRPVAALSQEPTGIPIDGTGNSARELVAPLAAQRTRWFGGVSERRRASRCHIPTLRVYYWTGSFPKPHEVVDISEIGAYFETRDRWSPGTIIELTLQRVRETDGKPADPHTSLHVVSKVVRSDPGGIGVQFVYARRHERLHARKFLALLTSA